MASARPVKPDIQLFGASRWAHPISTPNMLLCWIRTKMAIAAANIATPIVSPHAVAAASWVLSGGEQPHSDEDKDELRRRADGDVDHHAGGGLRA